MRFVDRPRTGNFAAAFAVAASPAHGRRARWWWYGIVVFAIRELLEKIVALPGQLAFRRIGVGYETPQCCDILAGALGAGLVHAFVHAVWVVLSTLQ